jgi:hypothetical protein
VKKAVYKTDGGRGLISSSIAPISGKNQRKFGAFDAVMVVALIVCTVALMRLLVAR